METKLLAQVRFLQACVVLLLISTTLLCINSFHPLLHQQSFRVIEAERIKIREKGGALKAVLSNTAGFNEGQRAEGERRRSPA